MTKKLVQVCRQVNDLYVCVRTKTDEIGDDNDMSDQVTDYLSINFEEMDGYLALFVVVLKKVTQLCQVLQQLNN